MQKYILGLLVFISGISAFAQFLPNPPILRKAPALEEEIVFEDEDQEKEIEEAKKQSEQLNVTAAIAEAVDLKNFYRGDTLSIQVPRSEIQKNNRWGAMSVPFDNFMSVTAYSNKKGGKWQCTELVHRYLKTTYGVPTKIGNGMGHANKLIQNLVARFGSSRFKYKDLDVQMVLRKAGVSQEPPAPGSVINFEIGKFGHTAVVRYVQAVDADTVKAYLFEQHGFPSVSVGDSKPIRVITFNRAANGTWSGVKLLGAGQAAYWINFKVL